MSSEITLVQILNEVCFSKSKQVPTTPALLQQFEKPQQASSAFTHFQLGITSHISNYSLFLEYKRKNTCMQSDG